LRNPRILTILIGVALALFMGALESTIVGTAMPSVVASLGGLDIYSWVFTAYILASTVTTPVWGKLGDMFGRRTALFSGLGLFILGSALAGASQTMPQLIAFRVIQGLGASALFPVGMTIVADLLTLEQRTKVVGLFSSMWGMASLIGPTVGGYLTEYSRYSWRGCFYIILPVGLVSALLIGASFRETRAPRESVPFDFAGTLVLSAALLLLLFTVERGTKMSWQANAGALIVCALLFRVFIGLERRHPEPLVPLELFRSRMVLIAAAHGLFAMMALIGTMSFLPLFVQGVIGTSAIQAGNSLTPLILSWVLSAIVAGRMILRFGYRQLVLAGMSAMLIGAGQLARVTEEASQLALSGYTILMGVGGGFVSVTLMIAAQHAVPRRLLGITTATVQFARNIGSALGVAAMGALLSGNLKFQLTHAPGELARAADFDDLASLVRPELRAGLSEAAAEFLRLSLADALRGAFIFVYLAAVIGAALAFFVPRGRAHDLAYREPEDDELDEEEEEAESAQP
jgi:EmrB/QacA subfamily drug resistance transporter